MSRLFGYVVIAVAILFGSFWFVDAACTPLGTTTPNFGFCKPAVGEVGWGLVVNANMDTIDANLTNSLPRSYLAGFTLANNAAATATKVDIAAGQGQDAGNAGAMALAATLTKDLSAAWAVGSGNGCLGTAVSRTASTWYHVFVIKRTDTSVVDAYCDTSISAANIPSPYTLFRRVGSIRTDGSNNILQFVQDGPLFLLALAVADATATNPGTSATNVTLPTVPPGVKTLWHGNIVVNNAGAGNNNLYVSALDQSDQAPNVAGSPGINLVGNSTGVTYGASWLQVRTSTAQQVRYRLDVSAAGTVVRFFTTGYVDYRGVYN